MEQLISFFDRSKGKWISQRTTYKLSNKQMNSLQSSIIIKPDQSSSNSQLIASLRWGEISRQIIKNLNNQDFVNGNFKFHLRFTNQFNTKQVVTLCSITDKSLITFKTRYGSTTVDETYWFATDNLRLSTSIIKQCNFCVAVSFCSEIKI
uniref:Chromophore lyase CpcS/CpeS homolog n=1 Tax=Porphyra purpurea TaxID=2787 RepID=CPXS_PORPU|nr:hypothetical protein PopuCp050 [Porphyra purpurea]P51235.1 RecName: Full=Chromophore lyase CpcS/CpeS homolog; AltName: Full=ORF149 [Porphyra purpurea]AAC08121.1 ORF149 [Porphyra purpurea]